MGQKNAFLGFNLTQNDGYPRTNDADDKFENLKRAALVRKRHKVVVEDREELKMSMFTFLSSSFGRRGTKDSPVSSAAVSRLRQRLQNVYVLDLLWQKALIQDLQKLGTTIRHG